MLVDRLAKRPVTVLTGARQTGKTTLVRDLLPDAGGPPAIYFSLDDPDERLRLGADPVRRLDHGTRLVILDKVQKHPGLLDAVKFLADRGEGRRFLLLGSAQIMLLRQLRETLAGRAALLELWPLALVERVDAREAPESGLDRIWTTSSGVAIRPWSRWRRRTDGRGYATSAGPISSGISRSQTRWTPAPSITGLRSPRR